jgi:hypothetical protein
MRPFAMFFWRDPYIVEKNGSSGRTRTYNPPVNRANQATMPANHIHLIPTKDSKQACPSLAPFGRFWLPFAHRTRTGP